MNRDQGFTLLELLISITIVAIITLLIFGALRIGARAWEKGEQNVEYLQRTRIVSDLVKRQIASACAPGVKKKQQMMSILKGDRKSMEFFSLVSVVPGNEFGKVRIIYAVNTGADDKERLLIFEKSKVLGGASSPRRGLDGKIADEPGDADFHVLIPQAEEISFEYAKADMVGKQFWQETWEPVDEKDFPAAVKITLRIDAETDPITTIAHVRARIE